jgi:hypothetical protein
MMAPDLEVPRVGRSLERDGRCVLAPRRATRQRRSPVPGHASRSAADLDPDPNAGSINPTSSFHGLPLFLPSTSQSASALAFLSRSTSAYTFVVASDTRPSHVRIALMSPRPYELRRCRVPGSMQTDPRAESRLVPLARRNGRERAKDLLAARK